ncbi:MAG TPA: redoxin domain-containing protein [Chitinophagaceae bacterium]|nr:redoxin domain-containing protein [Chitinophagaceae bacterium]
MMKGIITAMMILIFGLSAQGQKEWHVYVFLAEECPICNFMGKPLNTIYKKYQDNVDFHAVFPVKNSNYKTSQLFKQQYDLLNFETLLDKDQTLTKQLGATVTPEVIITNAQGEIHYKGRINSAYYAPGKMKHSSIKNDLDQALAALISGKDVPQPWPAAIGCYITTYASR